MYMFKARIAAENDLQRALEETGVTLDQVREFVAKNPKYQSARFYPTHKVASTAANLVYEVAPYLTLSRAERAKKTALGLASSVKSLVESLPGAARKAAVVARDPGTWERIREDATLVRDLAQGKAVERFAPLVKKLAGDAFFKNNPEVVHLTNPAPAMAAE
jgi:hypothetical protein